MPLLELPPLSRRTQRGRPSLYSADEASAWRKGHGLKVREMADLLGWPRSTLSKKLNGHLLLTLDFDRQVQLIDAVVRSGQIPPGAPTWLASSIVLGRGWERRRP